MSIGYHRLNANYPRTGLRRVYRPDHKRLFPAFAAPAGATTYNQIATGGVVAGISAVVRIRTNKTATGGAVAGGSANINVYYNPVLYGFYIGLGSIPDYFAASGVVVGGTSTVRLITNPFPSWRKAMPELTFARPSYLNRAMEISFCIDSKVTSSHGSNIYLCNPHPYSGSIMYDPLTVNNIFRILLIITSIPFISCKSPLFEI